jgi:uncharacterized coiled-coil protein SlyX
MNTEERLIDLEIRLSRQDDLVDTLNTQVYRQQKKLMSWKPCVLRWQAVSVNWL